MAKIPINMKTGEIDTKEIIIGIDLGTTNSLVAYLDNGKPKIISDANGKSTLVPSIVYFDHAGNAIVGETAKAHLLTEPGRTIYSVKRLLGKSYGDLDHYSNKLSYKIIDNEGQMVKVQVDDQFYSPVVLSAEILRYLKNRIESHLDQAVSKAVITVPAYFDDSQRQATRDAGKLAGLEVLRIVNEPTAASLAYGYGKKSDDSEIVLVYDLGGGTFDVSIMRIENGIFDVLSTKGDTFLGGDDFDQCIRDFWIEKCNINAQQLSSEMKQMLRMRSIEAKVHLSKNDSYQSDDMTFALSKKEFNLLIKPIIDNTLSLVEEAIKDASINKQEINKILLVGGSTRVALVKEELQEMFNVPVLDDINPDEVVALGAAIQADILAGNSQDYLLIDVTPLSLGIETVGGLMDVIIPRNSKIPIGAGRQYTTSVDGQKNLKISVFQGERDLVEYNRKLGEFILSNLPPMAAGMPKIEVQFIIDADGILNVKAKELRSGLSTEIKIQSQYGISEKEMGQMLLDSIQNAEKDMAVKALQEVNNEAKSIINATNKFLEQNKEMLTEDETARLVQLRNSLSDSLNSKSKDEINLAIETLNEYSRPIAERAMNYNITKALSGKTID